MGALGCGGLEGLNRGGGPPTCTNLHNGIAQLVNHLFQHESWSFFALAYLLAMWFGRIKKSNWDVQRIKLFVKLLISVKNGLCV